MTKSLVPTPEVLAEAARQRRKEQQLKSSDGPDSPLHEPAEAEKEHLEADTKA
ncbi:MAG: hypothetical protein QOC94_4588 [Actinoplanes sp.]|jgi:hypothetical protein|nr:hypothetical protein [Actinoplanes sp.]MDT5034417.1 hypothetical protein [Actinoplanes sp.]MDT5041708.1 hypothetical protein [Actinoplanes sp.]